MFERRDRYQEISLLRVSVWVKGFYKEMRPLLGEDARPKAFFANNIRAYLRDVLFPNREWHWSANVINSFRER
jgi:hypothetical protein